MEEKRLPTQAAVYDALLANRRHQNDKALIECLQALALRLIVLFRDGIGFLVVAMW